MLSGQIGVRVDSTMPDDPIDQLDVAWDDLERDLRPAGMDIRDLVKVTLYLVGDVNTRRQRELFTRRLGTTGRA